MSFLIGFLTVILMLNCLLLILLVLIQLPKKEAGAGLAFGGAATDALFGAGSGNVLTKVTKYATIAFFVLAMFVSILQNRYYHREGTEFKQAVEQQSRQLPAQPPLTSPSPGGATIPPASDTLNFPPPAGSNSTALPVAPATPAKAPAAGN